MKERKITMKISVIIPVYNVEKYLKRCIESVINQTIKDLEIILVDDGSTDSSGRICDEYAKKDKRIKVIHKENGGLSDARNAGLDIARGYYISFVDSDDYIDNNMIEKLYYGCTKNNTDIAICDKILELENGKKFKEKMYNNSCELNQKETYENILLYSPSVWNKLFKRELFTDIRFPKGKLYEDIITTNKLIDKSNKTFYVEGTYYHYIQRQNSIVHKNFNINKLDYINNAKELYEFILKRYPDILEQCDAYYMLVLSTVISDMYLQRNQYKIQYNKYIKELSVYKKRNKKNKYISKLKKIMIELISYKLVLIVVLAKKIKDILKYK